MYQAYRTRRSSFLNLKYVSKWLQFSAFKFYTKEGLTIRGKQFPKFYLPVAFTDPYALGRIIARLCGATKLSGSRHLKSLNVFHGHVLQQLKVVGFWHLKLLARDLFRGLRPGSFVAFLPCRMQLRQ